MVAAFYQNYSGRFVLVCWITPAHAGRIIETLDNPETWAFTDEEGAADFLTNQPGVPLIPTQLIRPVFAA